MDGRKAAEEDHDSTAADIVTLAGGGVDLLREAWRKRFSSAAPPIQSSDILRRLFAWKIQAETYGDLDTETVAELRRARTAMAKGKAPVSQSNASSLRAGTILVREWRGTMHRVLVLDAGFEHEGNRFGSLSEVARAISGTRWSGPRFFGLQERPAQGSRKASAEEASP